MSFFQPHPPTRPLVEWVSVQAARHREPRWRLYWATNQKKQAERGHLFTASPSLCTIPQGFVFCSLHRLPEQHGCLFDHLGHGRQEAVQKVVKLRRRVGRSCQRIGEEFSWTSALATSVCFFFLFLLDTDLQTNWAEEEVFFFLLLFFSKLLTAKKKKKTLHTLPQKVITRRGRAQVCVRVALLLIFTSKPASSFVLCTQQDPRGEQGAGQAGRAWTYLHPETWGTQSPVNHPPQGFYT